MNRDELKAFCREELVRHGFRKKGPMYFLEGERGILCGIWLKFSQFGPSCGMMTYYYIGEYASPAAYPTRYEYDLVGSIEVLSKVTDKGKRFLTGWIDYEQYSAEELRPYVEKALEETVLPAVGLGAAFLARRITDLRVHHTKEKTEILEKLLRSAARNENGALCQYLPLGLKRGTVALQPHNPWWAVLAGECIGELKSLLGTAALDIQHVGSTAIGGIHAKPILDIAVGVKSLETVEKYLPLLERNNIICRGSDHPGQLLFVKGDFEQDTRTHHIHVVVHGGEEWENYLNFRDFLNACRERAVEYNRLKVELAEKYGDDRAAYTAGKGPLVGKLLEEARLWRKGEER